MRHPFRRALGGRAYHSCRWARSRRRDKKPTCPKHTVAVTFVPRAPNSDKEAPGRLSFLIVGRPEQRSLSRKLGGGPLSLQSRTHHLALLHRLAFQKDDETRRPLRRLFFLALATPQWTTNILTTSEEEPNVRVPERRFTGRAADVAFWMSKKGLPTDVQEYIARGRFQ